MPADTELGWRLDTVMSSRLREAFDAWKAARVETVRQLHEIRPNDLGARDRVGAHNDALYAEHAAAQTVCAVLLAEAGETLSLHAELDAVREAVHA